jgi:hypothetical protein
MLSQLSVSTSQSRTRPAILTERRQDNFVLHPDRYIIHYLIAYLGAVAGGLSQRGLVIHAVELTPSSQSLGCSITLDPPCQRAGFSAPAWVAYQASWDEHRGWCCQAGLSRVQTLGTLGLARPTGRHTQQELADDLIRFTPTCTWIG